MNSISSGSICWNIHSVKVNLVSLHISFHLFLTQTAAIFRVALEDMLYKAAQGGRWITMTKTFFSANIHQICGKKSRLAAVLSQNRFETNVFKLHIFHLNNKTRRMRHLLVLWTLLRTYRVFSLYACRHLFFVIRKGSSYILKNAHRACNIRKVVFRRLTRRIRQK